MYVYIYIWRNAIMCTYIYTCIYILFIYTEVFASILKIAFVILCDVIDCSAAIITSFVPRLNVIAEIERFPVFA